MGSRDYRHLQTSNGILNSHTFLFEIVGSAEFILQCWTECWLQVDGVLVRSSLGRPLVCEFEVAESDSSQLLAKSSSTTGGIQEVEQTAPLQDGPAAWTWDFVYKFLLLVLHFGKIPKKFGQKLAKFSKILVNFAKFWEKISKKFSNF